MSASSGHLGEIERLLAESPDDAARRERETWQTLLRQTDGGVVLFGAGRLGKLCAHGLQLAGVPLRAFCDRNAALHGTLQNGLEVLAPEEAARRFGSSALFVVAIWTGTAKESMVERLNWLRGLGCRHVTTYAPLVWACAPDETPFHSFDLPTRVLARAGEWKKLAHLLADGESQRVLLTALRQRLLGEFDAQPPASDQYFPADILPLTEEEGFIDGGAFDGDTLEAFLKRTEGKFAAYHAFEPDPANLERLRSRIAELPEAVRARIHVHAVALHSEATELTFSTHGAPTSHAAKEGNVVVLARTLDEEVDSTSPITLLKLDVEGAERAALAGARRLLARRGISAAVCVYHHPDDLWELPLQLHESLPERRLYLRQHGIDGWEAVCYAPSSDRACGVVAASAQTIPKTAPRPCPVCESTGAREVLHRQKFFEGPLGDGYDVVVCGNCGAGFADGIPTQAELDHYYAERSKYTYAHAGGVESPYDFRRFEIIADQLEPYLPSKEARILDIGCATGGLLSRMKSRGYHHLCGSDPSPACGGAAWRLHGIEVRTATLAEHAAWTEKFDVILLVGVLEHVNDVRNALRSISSLLRPGGIFYCAQPDVESFTECHNAPYQQFSLEHVNFFSRASLTRLMASMGLAPRATWRWMIEWRGGITDSVVSALFIAGATSIARDTVSGPALRNYITRCAAQDRLIAKAIDAALSAGEPWIVWGAGTLTRRLLASGRLSQTKIVAFVDTNPALCGTTLAGSPVISPKELDGYPGPILVCSVTFEREIVDFIRNQLKLKNRILTLTPV
jgi:FkbM family methyltransferase